MLRFHKFHPTVAYEDLTEKYHSSGENKVMDVLMEMKSKDKEILILYYIEGYTCREIKDLLRDLLRISESAVKKRLERARKNFRKMYEE